MNLSLYLALGDGNLISYITCRDPEKFVRGSPTPIFLVDEGR